MINIMQIFQEWSATQGGNIDLTNYEAFKAGYEKSNYELLEALKQMIGIVDYYTPKNGYDADERKALQSARALIAKAEAA